MRTIVEPKKSIAKLWGKQRVKESDTYRMMKYVIRVDCEDNVLLHNVVTGQLIALEKDEASLLERLPLRGCSEIQQLIEYHYLVDEMFDEHDQVVKMRRILNELQMAQQKPGITHYTILPTTACNARCYYCFEHGAKTVTMTEQTANSVVDYIKSHCGEKKQIAISWFGGEPTVAATRIDQICEGLWKDGIEYRSDIITNGYLFDEKMATKAKELWNLEQASITLDGTENTYNRIKSYVGVKDNPYQRVLTNVGLLLSQGITVTLRMNFDLNNYFEFKDLLKELKELFSDNHLLQIRVHPIVGEYTTPEGTVSHGSEKWFEEKTYELNSMARENGFLETKIYLPYLKFTGCQANQKSSVTITPEGKIVRCPEQFGEDQITGNIWDGVTNIQIVKEWKEFADYPRCRECVLFPFCERLKLCNVKDRCCYSKELITEIQNSMKHMMCS